MYENNEENRGHDDSGYEMNEAQKENMRRFYRWLEYVAVGAINIIFAIFYRYLLNIDGAISTVKIYQNEYAAAIGWFLYGGSLCLALRCAKIEEQGWFRPVLKAVIFGAFTTAIKMGLDHLTDWIVFKYWGAKKIFVVSGLENAVFILFLIIILFALFVRGKVHWSIQAAKPITGIVLTALIYYYGVNNVDDWLYYGYTTDRIYLNVWLFALFVFMLWWLLNTLYDEKENVNEKISRRINIGVVSGLVILFAALVFWLYCQKLSLPTYLTYPYEVTVVRGYANIEGYLSDEKEVEIPRRIWWAKVEYIGGGIFNGLGTDIIVHDVPEGVYVAKLYHQESQSYFGIGTEASFVVYAGNESKVEIPEEVWGRKVTKMYGLGFQGLEVEEVIIPETVTYIDSAFSGCEKLKQITLPSQLETIGSNAFYGSGIESIVLPESVKEIGEEAFQYSKIKEVTGIENVEYIGDYAFRGTPWEESIEGDFVCIGDVLYLYRGDEEEVVIPSGIKEIRGAFAVEEEYPYPQNVRKVFIPESVTAISAFSFRGQKGLEVYIPETVTSLGTYFGGGQRTETIFENDSEARSANIIITTKDSPAVDHAVKDEDGRFKIISKEEMQQEMEKAASHKKEEPEKEISIRPKQDNTWINKYIGALKYNNDFIVDEYALIYIDGDDIPELVGNKLCEYYQICSCLENKKAECYEQMPYGSYAQEYYYLPYKNSIICTYTDEEGKEFYTNSFGLREATVYSDLNENYIGFYKINFCSKEEMLNKLYEYRDESEENARKEEDAEIAATEIAEEADGESYTVEGDAFSPFMYDIDEDGKADKIELLCEVSNKYAIESLTLQVGDLKKSIEINAEDMSEELIYKDLKCYILHIGEKNLIYIHTSRALDELYFGVVCEVTESGINVLNDKAGIGIDAQPLVDPQNVVCRTENGLLDRVGYFYTLSCWKFDEAGQVSRKKETEYFLSEGFKVKAIAELTADEVGEDDAVIESQVVLPVGTIMVPLRTDNETYVDFTSEEGKIYRVPFEVGIEDDGGRTGFIQGTVASEWMVVVV